jgi:hypothetical protein
MLIVIVSPEREDTSIFSSSSSPRLTTIANGLLSPVGKDEPDPTLMDVAELETLDDNVVLKTAPENSLLSI